MRTIPANAINAADLEGHVHIVPDGADFRVYYAGDVIPASDLPDLILTKVALTNAVESHARVLRDKLVRNVSPGEMASWSLKLAEAKLYSASSLVTDAPMLDAEASARGVPLSEVVARVLSNGANLSMMEALISGACGKHKDAISAQADVAALLQYDWKAGWPTV
jgi:hypothetical protein